MPQTPFQIYYMARMLENLPDEDRFVPVFASSDIKIYPFQIAAASFALRSPYQTGVILCDEAGMGKSHEAMLIITQRWLEGRSRILVAVPNADLLLQWTEMLDRFYTIPYVILTNSEQWNENSSEDQPNAFMQDAVIITTYDFAADHEAEACEIKWDLTVFEEANALSGVYQTDNKQAKSLKRIADDSFKLLLTGTPIEKNIMDLYGLIWFIDETVLSDEKEFLARVKESWSKDLTAKVQESYKDVLKMPKIKADSPEGKKAYEYLKANSEYETLDAFGFGSDAYKNNPLETEAYAFGDKIEAYFNKFCEAYKIID